MKKSNNKSIQEQRLELDKLTNEMFEFVERETGFTKSQLLSIEENDELRDEITDAVFDIEVEEIDDDGNISKRGENSYHNNLQTHPR